MIDAVAIAFGAISPLGEGAEAFSPAREGSVAITAVASDDELRRAGLSRSAAARCPRVAPGELLVERAMSDCVRQLGAVFSSWRSSRVGLVLGTSSGEMLRAEPAYSALARGEHPSAESARSLAYGASFDRIVSALGVRLSREAHVLGACASSTIACGIAQIWLSAGDCDVVLAGGYDEVSLLVASGFVALGAVTSDVPRPFREGRDGLAIGEGACVAAFVRADSVALPSAKPLLIVGGFGASTDAVHITAPDRLGRGLHRAIDGALRAGDCGQDQVGTLSAHGTATSYNDAAEWAAFRSVFGEARARSLPMHAMKGETGHLFGAAGILESLALAGSMTSSIALPTAGHGAIDPETPAMLRAEAWPHVADFGIKTALAFGGLNAALLLAKAPRVEVRALSRTTSLANVEARSDGARAIADLAEKLGVPVDRLTRTDALVRIVLDVVLGLRDALVPGSLDGAGVVVGHDVANIATNATYWSKLLARGARFAEPRRFPYTSPNACAAEVAILFGLHGPAFAVGGYPGGEVQALDIARDLVSARVCDRVIVVEVSESSNAASALFASWGLPNCHSYARARLVTVGLDCGGFLARRRAVVASARLVGIAPMIPRFARRRMKLPYALLAVPVVAASAFISGCSTHYIPNTDVEDTDDNRDIVRFCEQYRKALERKDVGTLLALASPRYYEDGGNVNPADDLDYEGLRDWLEGRFQDTKAIRYEIRYRRVEKGDQNHILVVYTYSAAYKVPGLKVDEWRHTVADNRLELESDGKTFKILAGM